MEHGITRVLLVEGEKSGYDIIKNLLSEEFDTGLNLDWASSGIIARDLLKQYIVDVCLIDYDIASDNSFDLIKNITSGLGPPIILLSPDNNQEAENSAKLAGAIDCLPKKRIDRSLLIRAIKNAVEKKKVNEALHQREQEFKALADNAPDIIARFDKELRHVYINPAVETVVGVPCDAFIGKTHRELGGPAEVIEEWEGILNRVFDTQEPIELEYPFCGRRTNRYFHSRLVPEFGQDGSVKYVLKISRDITERKRMEEELRLRDRAIQATTDGVIIVDARSDEYPIVYANPAFERITGYKAKEVIGQSWRVIQGERSVAEWAVLQTALINGTDASLVLRSYRKNGAQFWNEMRIAPIYDPEGFISHYVAVMCDITARKALELEHAKLLADALEQADRDPLTGLLNHRAFHKHLIDAAEYAVQEGREMAMVVMDINNFRFLNEAYGHSVGDEVLQRVAHELKKRLPAVYSLARFGGDEFAIIIPNIKNQTIEDLEHRFERFFSDIDYCPPGYDTCIPLSVCAGAAFLGLSSRLQMLQQADERLRRKKMGSEEQLQLSAQLRVKLASKVAGFSMLDALVTAVDTKDRYTRKHSEDVMKYSLQIANELGLDQKTQQTIAVAALLHDVGKTGLPDLILRKPGALTDEEYESVKQHPMMGAAIVGAVAGFEDTLDCIRHHHERWDGKGYPFGLVREECPILARLMAVADAMSAMTTDRPYRKALPMEESIKRLQEGAGTQWDPVCIEAFIKSIAKSENNTYYSKSLKPVNIDKRYTPIQKSIRS